MSEDGNFTIEQHIRVYDDKHGWYVTVRPDRDGSGACEIAWNDGSDAVKDERCIVMPWPMARLLAGAIADLTPMKPGQSA
jgi:hypothetical protein